MRVSDKWQDYCLIDASDGNRLEVWGDYVLIRPDPQVIWDTPRTDPRWKKAHGIYRRSKTGGGGWQNFGMPDNWCVSYGELTFRLRPMGFKHTGLFPEQAVNWDLTGDLIRRRIKAGGQVSVLNLFAYTGGATAAAAKAGASVVHVDAAKGMVQAAKENLQLSGLGEAPVRYIVDDCRKFVEREIRRGKKYHGIIMDPPSYGRGPGGEVWKLEEAAFGLISLAARLLADEPLFFLINSYTTGISPSSMGYMLQSSMPEGMRGRGSMTADEIGLPVKNNGLVLPAGASAIWTADE